MKKANIPWVEYKKFPNTVECDFHFGPEFGPHWQFAEATKSIVFEALEQARNRGNDWVLFTHGSSTSRVGRETARSIVRRIMRSPSATPFIQRSECIQQESVFVARIRPTENWDEVKAAVRDETIRKKEEDEETARNELPGLVERIRVVVEQIRWPEAKDGMTRRLTEILAIEDPTVSVEKLYLSLSNLEGQASRKVGIFGEKWVPSMPPKFQHGESQK